MAKMWLCTIRPDGTEVLGSDGSLPVETRNPAKLREYAGNRQRSLRKNFAHNTGDVWAISDYLFKSYAATRHNNYISWPEYLKRCGTLVYKKEDSHE